MIVIVMCLYVHLFHSMNMAETLQPYFVLLYICPSINLCGIYTVRPLCSYIATVAYVHTYVQCIVCMYIASYVLHVCT